MSPEPSPGNFSANGPSDAADTSAEHHRQPRLLIVEDDSHTQRALNRLLQRSGLRPIAFHTAAEAIRFLQEPAAGQVSGAVVDVHLPDGDGIDLTRQLRARLGPEVPIVIVSGDTSMETLARLRDAGADRFVGKPMSLEALHDALRLPD